MLRTPLLDLTPEMTKMLEGLPQEDQIWATLTGIARGRKRRLHDGVLTPAEVVTGCLVCAHLVVAGVPDGASAEGAQAHTDKLFLTFAEAQGCPHWAAYLTARASRGTTRRVATETMARLLAQVHDGTLL